MVPGFACVSLKFSPLSGILVKGLNLEHSQQRSQRLKDSTLILEQGSQTSAKGIKRRREAVGEIEEANFDKLLLKYSDRWKKTSWKGEVR